MLRSGSRFDTPVLRLILGGRSGSLLRKPGSLSKGVKVHETAVGAVFAPSKTFHLRPGCKQKSLLRNSGVGGGGRNLILIRDVSSCCQLLESPWGAFLQTHSNANNYKRVASDFSLSSRLPGEKKTNATDLGPNIPRRPPQKFGNDLGLPEKRRIRLGRMVRGLPAVSFHRPLEAYTSNINDYVRQDSVLENISKSRASKTTSI